MTDLQQQISGLSPEKRRLLALLLQKEGIELKRAPIRRRTGPGDTFPVSFAQQRLWFLNQLEPLSPVYNLPSAFRLTGRLDLDAAGRALNEIVRRHEALRTTFRWSEGHPVQHVAAEVRIPLPVAEAAEAEIRSLVEGEARQPFDLARGPLLRARLFRLAEEDHLAVVTMHHIISDGWSMGVVVREFAALYQAFAEGRPSPLPELPVQYPDYAIWQREQGLDGQLEWWKRQLAGELPILNLPTDRPRSAMSGNSGASFSFMLPPGVASRLKALADRERATLFMALLAVFKLLLARHSRQSEICIGTPVAGRAQAELEPLIGFFVNTLVIRTDLGGDPTFLELLKRVRESALGAFGHQDAPFEMLVEAVNPERRLNHTPLFQAMFVLQNTPPANLKIAGAKLEPVQAETGLSMFDLTLSMAETPRGLAGSIEYDADLFDENTIQRIAGRYGQLIDAILEDPERRISELNLLSDAEKCEALAKSAGPAQCLPGNATVHGLIEAQAARTPGAAALIAGGRAYSYRELNAAANRLANHLRRAGAGPEARIGVSMERSADLMIAILGILKAGAAYVPLDPAYPAERLAWIRKDAGIRMVLEELPDLSAEPETDPPPSAGPENAAYIIYTSGSTGVPKGVVVPHRAVVNHNLAVIGEFSLAPADRVLQFATVNFDTAVEEIFPTWIAGAALVLSPGGVLMSAEELSAFVAANRVSVLDLPTAYWQEWTYGLSLARQAIPEALRLVIVGGEKAAADRLELWRSLHGSGRVRWLNTYGPTETTVSATAAEPAGATGEIPIGKPIANVRAYVLGPRGELLPPGMPGELYIGGAGVARGYHRRPDMTAERFLPDPFSGEAGARMYRTGDLARHRPDGNLEFLGRVDFQIKIRGFRVEPGEIESVLVEFPGIRQAHVELRDGRLIAWVAGHRPALADLRAHLRANLPEYMIPGAFVTLPALPLTPNGKVDRRALPEPDRSRPDVEPRYAAPRTPVEEILCGMWAQLLNLERVGTQDGFFELGGHSLLATQLISRVRDTFGVEVPLRALFETPNVAGLAQAIEQAKAPAPPIVPAERPPELPLSFAQQRLWFLEQLEPGTSRYHIPDVVRLRGRLDIARWENCLNRIVARHETLRTGLHTVEGRAVARIIPEMRVSIPVSDCSEEQAPEVIAAEIRKPFDLATAPLFRLRLLRLAQDDHILVVTMHHIVSDGWSAGVLIREFVALYQDVRLQPLPVQYADFALWQRNWLKGEILESEIAYWVAKLGPDLAPLELPTDRPRPPVSSGRGAGWKFGLSQRVSDKIRRLGGKESATSFMVLLAAFQALLHRYTGQDAITVGSPIANRTRREIEPLIGFFVNTLVFKADFSANPTFRDFLQQVRETALGAYAHQDVPFEMLVDKLQPARDLTRTPLFQAMFILQNTPPAALSISGLRLEPLPVEIKTTAFDLTLAMSETANGFAGAIEYDADLFDEGTVARLAERFERLVEAVVDHPERRISQLHLLSPAEKSQVLGWAAGAEMCVPERATIHGLIEERVARTPGAIALVAGGREFSYAELNREANRLAHWLRKAGAGPESRIGVSMERSAELMIAILGILKAGAAYVPLDPAYPAERLDWIRRDAGIEIVLTGLPDLAGEPDGDPAPLARPENTAYVIYTSGSTGVPKGVLIPHRAVVNHNLAVIQEFGLGPADRVLQFATINFDTAVEEIFPTWIAGAALVLSPAGVLLSAEEFSDFAEQNRVSFLDLPTAYWQEWTYGLSLARRPVPAGLRLVVVGGEKAAADRLELWQSLRGAEAVRWVNTYGPTEATVSATAVEPAHAAGEIPIGKPLANVRTYVLGRRLELLPPGLPGELCIGGAGVARGYHQRPEATAERFVPDPFAGVPGARMYRTGDLVRFRPDGNLEFLGRLDHQVKVRGFRIELGEIESALGAHQSVKDAVVVVREDSPGEKRLTAYVTGNGATPEAAGLREHLKQRLPEYMLPAAFVVLERLPLTPNGKVDRRALPAPSDGAQADQPAGTGPRTPAEGILAEVWCEVLGRKSVGIDQNFFELGGDSILSIQVVAKAGQRGLRFTPRQLFERPTIARLAEVAVIGQGVAAEQGIVAGPLPATPIQRWFLEQNLPDPNHFNQSVLLELDRPLDREQLEAAVRKLLEHHDVLRLREKGGELRISGIEPGAPVVYTADFEAVQASLNLEDGPVVRVAYAEEPPRLLIVVHHLAMDGVSWRILLEDFERAYRGLALPAKTTSFRQWAGRLAEHAATPQVAAELPYWHRVWDGVSFRLPAGTEASTQSIGLSLDPEETEALLKQVPPVYHTEINDALLAGLALALTEWLGTGAVVVDLEGHGREQIADDLDISRTVGWFTTMYPVRLEVAGRREPGEALKAIKEQLRAVPNRGLGYGLLRNELGGQPSTPFSFNYLGQFDQAIGALPTGFRPAREPRGTERSPLNARSHAIEVTASVARGRLGVEWSYNAEAAAPGNHRAPGRPLL